jgi:lipopolysaccharide/colanic/teichoic acid biosynthesis glycosyltransferase
MKGEMKLVGVRPVSKIYFEQLPKELKEQRLRFKPGCIPPYVAFNEKSSLNSVLECEKKYLDMKSRNPYFTDTKLFFIAIFNIVFKGKRSG